MKSFLLLIILLLESDSIVKLLTYLIENGRREATTGYGRF